MSDWTSAGAQLHGVVDGGWRVDLYRHESMLTQRACTFVAEASGGGVWDDEIVGEGDTPSAAIDDMAEKMLALAGDEDDPGG